TAPARILSPGVLFFAMMGLRSSANEILVRFVGATPIRRKRVRGCAQGESQSRQPPWLGPAPRERPTPDGGAHRAGDFVTVYRALEFQGQRHGILDVGLPDWK